MHGESRIKLVHRLKVLVANNGIWKYLPQLPLLVRTRIRPTTAVTTLSAILFAAVTIAILMGPTVANATAGISPDFSFEGKIVTSAGLNIPDGTYNMEFKIYTGCTNEPTNNTGCTLAWTEDWLNNNTEGVTFTSGTFQANLGSVCPFTGGT